MFNTQVHRMQVRENAHADIKKKKEKWFAFKLEVKRNVVKLFPAQNRGELPLLTSQHSAGGERGHRSVWLVSGRHQTTGRQDSRCRTRIV